MNQKIKFPIYVLSEEPEEIDGLVLIGDQVVDDKNMSGATIGMRRLQTPREDRHGFHCVLNLHIDVVVFAYVLKKVSLALTCFHRKMNC